MPFRWTHLGERKLEIMETYAAKSRQEQVQKECNCRGEHASERTRQNPEQLRHQPDRNIFEPINHELASTVAPKVFDVNATQCKIRVRRPNRMRFKVTAA